MCRRLTSNRRRSGHKTHSRRKFRRFVIWRRPRYIFRQQLAAHTNPPLPFQPGHPICNPGTGASSYISILNFKFWDWLTRASSGGKISNICAWNSFWITLQIRYFSTSSLSLPPTLLSEPEMQHQLAILEAQKQGWQIGFVFVSNF